MFCNTSDVDRKIADLDRRIDHERDKRYALHDKLDRLMEFLNIFEKRQPEIVMKKIEEK